MARLARVVIPGLPHHVTQRGNGRALTFFADADYALYRDPLAASCRACAVEIWSWVLMPNHVHLILVPSDEDGLRRALAPVHRRYAGLVHARQRRTGHFWQGRYGAVVLDEPHLAAAVRYVAQNPVRARMVAQPADWPWSSVHAHLSGQPDGMTTIRPVLDRLPDFAGFIASDADGEAAARLRRAETIGRPLGDEAFLAEVEALTNRALKPAKRRPKSAVRVDVGQVKAKQEWSCVARLALRRRLIKENRPFRFLFQARGIEWVRAPDIPIPMRLMSRYLVRLMSRAHSHGRPQGLWITRPAGRG